MKGHWEKEESQTNRELATRTTGRYESWEIKEKEIKLINNKLIFFIRLSTSNKPVKLVKPNKELSNKFMLIIIIYKIFLLVLCL